MAIYHFSVKTVSRSDGRSAVAAAAYRSGSKLVCEKTGDVKNYTRKSGVEHSQIFAPDFADSSLLDRNTLWNTVEKAERRKDAVVGREFEIAFPHELNAEQRQQMLAEICTRLVEKYGVIVDAAIHQPHKFRNKNDENSEEDNKNYHAHIMFTPRSIDPDFGFFAKKKYRDFNKECSSETVNFWREEFAEITNRHLEDAGVESRVDHRSYVEQGNGLTPTLHEGPAVTEMRRKNIVSEVAELNDAIKLQNAEIKKLQELDQEIFVSEKLLSQTDYSHLLKEIEQLDLAENHIDFELEQFARQANEIDLAYEKFSELQKVAIEYVKSCRSINDSTNADIASIEKHHSKSQKWLSRKNLPEDYFSQHEGLYRDETPDFYISTHKANFKIESLDRKRTEKFVTLAKQQNISEVFAELDKHAKFLTEQGIELPIEKSNFLQKIGFQKFENYHTAKETFVMTLEPILKEHNIQESKSIISRYNASIEQEKHALEQSKKHALEEENRRKRELEYFKQRDRQREFENNNTYKPKNDRSGPDFDM